METAIQRQYERRFNTRHSPAVWADIMVECGAAAELWPEFEPDAFLAAVEFGAYELIACSVAGGWLRRALWSLAVVEGRTRGGTGLAGAVCRYWLVFAREDVSRAPEAREGRG